MGNKNPMLQKYPKRKMSVKKLFESKPMGGNLALMAQQVNPI